MGRYRGAFERADVDALVDCFAFPVQIVTVTQDGASISIADAGDWPGVLARLLGAYRRLGVASIVLQEMELHEPIGAVAVVRVRWALERADGGAVYDFTGTYTVASMDGRHRIVALAHDELPKMRAALARA